MAHNGSDNLMSSDGTFNYQHDADGNQTVRTRISNTYATDYQTAYSWDYRNRLTDVNYYDNNSVLTKHLHLVYDVFDHLIATEVDPNGSGSYTQIQRYVLDVSPEIPQAGVPGTALAQPDLVFDGGGNLIQRNLVSLDRAGVDAVVAQEAVTSPSQGGVVTWMANNNLGSVVDVVDNSGALANHIVYSAFGQDVYESNSTITHWAGFAGGHTDPSSGLVNDYHRWYDPASGRWVNEDPNGFAAGDTNESRYSRNAPAVGADLTGLEPTYTVNKSYFDDLLKNNKDIKNEYKMSVMTNIYSLSKQQMKLQQQHQALLQYMEYKYNLNLQKYYQKQRQSWPLYPVGGGGALPGFGAEPYLMLEYSSGNPPYDVLGSQPGAQ